MFNSLFNSADKYISKIISTSLDNIQQFENRFMPLPKNGRNELFLFNVIFGWHNATDRNKIKLTSENADKIVRATYEKLGDSKNYIPFDEFLKIFEERYTNYEEEIDLCRKSLVAGSDLPHYPHYFFSKILDLNMTYGPVPNVVLYKTDVQKIELTLLFNKHIQNLISEFGNSI